MQHVAATGTGSSDWTHARASLRARTSAWEARDWVGAGWIALTALSTLGTAAAFALAL